MQVTVAQNPPNERSDDKVFVTDNAVIMLDGASAFLPVPVPAALYAATLGCHLQHTLRAEPGADLRALLAAGIERTTYDLGPTRGQSPSSTVTIVREIAECIDVLVLGDNTVVFPDNAVTDARRRPRPGSG